MVDIVEEVDDGEDRKSYLNTFSSCFRINKPNTDYALWFFIVEYNICHLTNLRAFIANVLLDIQDRCSILLYKQS